MHTMSHHSTGIDTTTLSFSFFRVFQIQFEDKNVDRDSNWRAQSVSGAFVSSWNSLYSNILEICSYCLNINRLVSSRKIIHHSKVNLQIWVFVKRRHVYYMVKKGIEACTSLCRPELWPSWPYERCNPGIKPTLQISFNVIDYAAQKR